MKNEYVMKVMVNKATVAQYYFAKSFKGMCEAMKVAEIVTNKGYGVQLWATDDIEMVWQG